MSLQVTIYYFHHNIKYYLHHDHYHHDRNDIIIIMIPLLLQDPGQTRVRLGRSLTDASTGQNGNLNILKS